MCACSASAVKIHAPDVIYCTLQISQILNMEKIKSFNIILNWHLFKNISRFLFLQNALLHFTAILLVSCLCFKYNSHIHNMTFFKQNRVYTIYITKFVTKFLAFDVSICCLQLLYLVFVNVIWIVHICYTIIKVQSIR